MAKIEPRSGKVNLVWSVETEASVKRLAKARGQTYAQVVREAVELAEIRYEAEQAALALHNLSSKRRTA